MTVLPSPCSVSVPTHFLSNKEVFTSVKSDFSLKSYLFSSDVLVLVLTKTLLSETKFLNKIGKLVFMN